MKAKLSAEQVDSNVTLYTVRAEIKPEELREIILDALVHANPRLAIIPARKLNIEWDFSGPSVTVTALHDVVIHKEYHGSRS